MGLSLDAVAYIAQIARQTWEPLWPEWKAITAHPAPAQGPPSTDTCIPTSLALREMLERCVHGWYWRVSGGRPTPRTPTGGYVDHDGQAHAHLWVEGRRQPGQRFIVDITADQFGGPAVVVETLIPVHYVANITRPLVRKYEQHEAPVVACWVKLLSHALIAMAQTDDPSDPALITPPTISLRIKAPGRAHSQKIANRAASALLSK